MSCTDSIGCDCGCCAGTSVQTPQFRTNLPGLDSVAYRAGDWANFKGSMLARLSSSDYPALAGLRTRDDSDFTIALLDASAMVLDILTFYQERLANESYLRTASQRRSLTELSRLVAYRPSPGVSANAYVAFTVRGPSGQAANPSTPAITIPASTQLQSVPAQGQTPQIFETTADIQAKSDWSALPVQTSRPWVPPDVAGSPFPTSIYLSGTATQLQPGDALLILGADREKWLATDSPASQSADGSASTLPNPREQWSVVILNQVQVNTALNLTYVSWDADLAHESVVDHFDLKSPEEEPPVELDVTFGKFPESVTPTATVWTNATVYAFRQRASLFGHNAPDANLFVNLTPNASPPTSLPNLIAVPTTPNGGPWSWKNFNLYSSFAIQLDAVYPKIVSGGWFALTSIGPDSSSNDVAQRYAQLFKVQSAPTVSIAEFALSGKVTQLAGDFDDLNISHPVPTKLLQNPSQTLAGFPLQSTQVLAQSEPLKVAPQPLTYPLYGTLLDLHDLRPDLAGLQVVALTGTRQKIAVNVGITALTFIPDAGKGVTALKPGDVLTVTTPPSLNADGIVPDWRTSADAVTLSVQDASGRTGKVGSTAAPVSLSLFTLIQADPKDPIVSEYVLVSSITSVSDPDSVGPIYPHTQIQLSSPMAYCYDRTAVTVNANVALATHGMSVSEFLGSGNASLANQSFNLKQSPLTYVSGVTATGRKSALEVRVNGVAWTEVPSLFEQGPSQAVFATLNQPDGTAQVLFGDGVEGSVLPSGQSNILANYRVGLGSAGNVGANSLTTLVDRPLGVSGVTNPSAATGGQDPQSADEIRGNAPLTVLTLGRAVSLADYENFAGTFAGISKAHALWIPSGPAQGVFLTVAGVDGAALQPGDPTLTQLVGALQNLGNSLTPITVRSFFETLFGFSADLRYDPSYDQLTVRAQVLQTLSQSYSFAQRTFGQGVSVDELANVIQAIPGVIAVNVTELHTVATSSAGDLGSRFGNFSILRVNDWRSMMLQIPLPRPFPQSVTQIHAYLPTANTRTVPQPAEILILDPDISSIQLGVMS